MAKKTMKIKSGSFDGTAASQEFTQLVAQNQVGDQFYVPTAESLLVLSTEVPMLGRDGVQLVDEEGNPRVMHVGQNFFAVRIIDGKPVEVSRLYVGQIVKRDVNNHYPFTNELYRAIRTSGDTFKATICNKILEIEEAKEIQDRVWDAKSNRWARDPQDENKLASRPGTAYRFEAKRHTLSKDTIEKCEEMLFDYYKENYAQYVTESEEQE